MSRTVDGAYYDTMDYLTKRMVDAGARCLELPPVDMHHVGGISVARQELGRVSRTLSNIRSLYDLWTAGYVCESIKRYGAMLDRWGQADDFRPAETDYRAIMDALAVRGIDVDDMEACLRAVQPLEDLFPPTALPRDGR